MTYRKITLEDKEKLRHFFEEHKIRLCDYTLGCTLMWEDFFNVEAYIGDDCLIIREILPDKYIYSLPLGDTEKGLQQILQEEQGDIEFTVIPEDKLHLFERDGFATEVVENRDVFDYLYKAEDLIKLSGKKYAVQRNHIHKFDNATESWVLEDVSKTNIQEILGFLDNVFTFGEKPSEDAVEEMQMVRNIVQKPDAYGMFGSALRANGHIVGFALAEVVGNIMFTHIEKADRNYPGAYQKLVNEFAKKYADESVEFINREDDAGDLGLRTAKLAYHPCELVKKYTVMLRKKI